MKNKHPLQKLLELSEGVSEYSGRGMFGRTCVAVTVQSPGSFVAHLARLIAGLDDNVANELSDEEVEIALDTLERGWTHDSMGKGIIIYFPNVPFVADLNPEEDEHTELEDDDDDE